MFDRIKAMDTAAVVRVQLLGGFRIELPDGRTAGPWERPSARRLFQVLVLRERPRMGREELADVLFRDLPPVRAANAVSKALTMARAALSPFPILQANRDVIWIDGPLDLDVEVARRALQNALAQPPGEARDAALVAALRHRGRLLDEELYADWATAQREGLERLRADATVALARDRAAGYGRSSPNSVADAWSDVLARDWSDEEACLVLLATYADLGQRDQVVRTYRRTVAALHELGVEPSEELKAQYHDSVAAAGRARPPRSGPAPQRTTFGRDETHSALLDAVTSRGRGSVPVVLVTGAPGIGKSHTLEVLRRNLRAAGWVVGHAGGMAGDSRVPMRALRALLSQVEDDGAQRLIRELGPDAEAPRPDGPAARSVLVSEVSRVLDRQAGRRPFVMILDDVQWMDSGLQGLLAELLAVNATRRWPIVLAARAGDRGFTTALPSNGRRFDLAPLSVDATEALVRHTSPHLGETTLRRVVARSGGNPFFALELARHGVAAGDNVAPPIDEAVPSLVRELLRTRLARCAPTARRVLPLVALLGEDASVEVILSLAGESRLAPDPDHTIAALDELVETQLLEAQPAGIRVAHPLLAEAALTMVSATRRAALHDLIASHLEDDAAASHRLAAFESSGRSDRAQAAADAAFRAGRHARRVFSDEAALELSRGGLRAFYAMAPANRSELRAAAVAAWLLVGEIHQERDFRAEANDAFEAALALADNDEERARVWSAKASLAYRVGNFEGAIRAYENGVASLLQPSALARARLEAELGWAHSRMGHTDEALALLGPATDVLAELGDDVTAGRALDRLATILGVAGLAAEGLGVMQRAFAALGTTGDERELGVLYVHRAALYGVLSRFGEALADITTAHRFATECGDRYRQSVIHWMASDIHERRGDPAAALAERDAELTLLEQVQNPRNAAAAHAARARILSRLERHEAAAEAAERAMAVAAEVRDESFLTSIEQQLRTRLPTF